MRSVVMEAPGKVVVNEVDKPTLLEPTDAIIKLAASCISAPTCGPTAAHSPSTTGQWATNTSAKSSK